MRDDRAFIRLHSAALATADAGAWFVGLFVAVWGRYDFDLMQTRPWSVLTLAGLAALLQWVVGVTLSLYRARYRLGAFEEVLGITCAAAVVGSLVMVAGVLWQTSLGLPRSAAVLGGPLALLIMIGSRYVLRMHGERPRRPRANAERVLIFGAGEAGAQLVRQMVRGPEGTYLPVGLLDDDPAKRHLRVCGVPVLGGRDALAEACSRTGASTLVVALPGADGQLLRDIDDRACAAGAVVKVLPRLQELIDGRVHVTDLRDIDVNDLLGRQPVDTDVAAIAGYITGRRVLVTGAGGSIGSELCRQLLRFGPDELILLDRDESALHAVQLSLYGRALLDTPDVVLADIRDAEALVSVFQRAAPHVVFHAAALKHLPMLEQYPLEAYKTNVVGTLNVLEASAAVGVDVFVNISTDKAADPTSVLGSSKRVAERLTAHYADENSGTYVSVRFGNVLGSRGSVLHTFAGQIASGGPVTITHPDVSRYFMTIPEACQLVIQAAAIGRGGDVLVLDMGEPVLIADVAQQLIRRSGRKIEVVYTGLRHGEKLREDLFGAEETDRRPLHPKISHVHVPRLKPVELSQAAWRHSQPRVG
jgi:FlaA1/EpsC-like NDP-sugar epimerase